jgi:hypothetical protein
MKPKPNYDEIHLEYYDQDEMDTYLEDLKETILVDITHLCGEGPLQREITKVINKRFGE